MYQKLNNALQRKQQTQQLLIKQNRQLKKITLKLNLYTTENIKKKQTLSKTIHINLKKNQ